MALGNVALRSTVAAARLEEKKRLTLPGLKRLEAAGLTRGEARPWPESFPPDPSFRESWADVRPGHPPPHLLWLLHPSAQNMSPHAGVETAFHTRMLDTVAALRRAMTEVLGTTPPGERPAPPRTGIYALPDWENAVGPRHAELDRLWRDKGV